MKIFWMVLVVLGLLVFGANCQKGTKEAKVETNVEEQAAGVMSEIQEASPSDTINVMETAPADTVPAQQ